MPLVSIIVPVYNVEKYIERCVKSLTGQTLQDIEIILIDDGSTDGSGSLCDLLQTEDSRIKVIHQKNAGVSAARNKGLEVATGEYIAFVDSDDYIDNNMYQSMIEIATMHNCDVVMCDCLKEFENHREVYTHDIRSGYYTREDIEKEYFQHLLMMPNVEYPPTISNWLCLFKQKNNDACGDDHKSTRLRYEEGIRFSEDLLFGAELLYQANSFYYMKGQCFYHYCMNPQSTTHTFAPNKWNNYVKLYNRIKDKFFECIDYDFSKQIDLVLLFFVYNSIGDILVTNKLNYKEKKQKIREILQEQIVRQMFRRVNIWKLPIRVKLKLLTFMYKHDVGIQVLIVRGKGKRK